MYLFALVSSCQCQIFLTQCITPPLTKYPNSNIFCCFWTQLLLVSPLSWTRPLDYRDHYYKHIKSRCARRGPRRSYTQPSWRTFCDFFYDFWAPWKNGEKTWELEQRQFVTFCSESCCARLIQESLVGTYSEEKHDMRIICWLWASTPSSKEEFLQQGAENVM